MSKVSFLISFAEGKVTIMTERIIATADIMIENLSLSYTKGRSSTCADIKVTI